MSFKIGVMIDSFRKSPREGLRLARDSGAEGFQLSVGSGEMTPETVDKAARVRFRDCSMALGMEVSALCGDLGGHGFERADENVAKIGRSKKIVDLAVDLGASVVTTHIGVIPDDKRSPIYKAMQQACQELGEYAASKKVVFAVETGPETAVLLKQFLDSLKVKGIGVNFDPANLVMVTGDDPVAAVATLAPYIVHTHAKDGRQLKPCDRFEVYGAFAEGGFDALVEKSGKLFEETPLGEGAVNWKAYLAALEKIGYKGYLTIERETGSNPAQDIRKAVAFLKQKIR
jgi:L-ribulose-5-phosphate 3-epimerase